MLSQLPPEVLLHILIKLNLEDVRNLMLTCKKLKSRIINDNALWKWINRNHVIIKNSLENRKAVTFLWYNLCRISHNWRRGIYRDRIVLQHQENFMPWLQYYNSEVLLISTGSNLYCYGTDNKGLPHAKNIAWKLEVPRVERCDVRTNDISRFIVRDKNIVCGKRDGSTSIYKFHHIKQKPQLLYYIEDCIDNGQVEVTAVELLNSSDTCLITASSSSTSLVVWKPNITNQQNCYTHETPYKLQQTTIQNAIGVKCLSSNINEDKLAVGLNGNSKPILIDIATGKISYPSDSIRNDKLAVRDIKWHNENTVIYVTHSGRLQFIDIRSGNVVYNVMDPFQSTLYCVQSDGERAVLVGSSEYSRCVLFDARNGSGHVQVYFTQKKSSPIYSLDFDSTKLIAATDRSVAILNFNVNVNAAQVRDYSQPFEFITNTSL